MSLETDIKLLGTVPMLSDFTEDKLRLLAFSAESRDFRDGQRLYSAGDRADCAHVVSSGEVALFPPGDAEAASEVVGRGALVGHQTSMVTVTGAWSEGRSQSRASFRTRKSLIRSARLGCAQMWSSRRPLSAARQSLAL
ncbi:MAG: crp 4 [Proteobacteria bacterium]|nr:crp 4 [Pseudomonadota bacterium]